MLDKLIGAVKDAQARVAVRCEFWKQEKIMRGFALSVARHE
jgi:hypothetical protein